MTDPAAAAAGRLTPTEAPMHPDARAAVDNLLVNQWNWDLPEFLRRTGLADDDYGRGKFRALQRAAEALRSLGGPLLAVVCAAPPPAAPTPADDARAVLDRALGLLDPGSPP